MTFNAFCHPGHAQCLGRLDECVIILKMLSGVIDEVNFLNSFSNDVSMEQTRYTAPCICINSLELF